MSGRGSWPRVLMIGLDAAEPALVEAWTADGTLPNLKSLMKRGAYGRLGSPAEWLSGAVWPSFYTSASPTEHGHYNYLMWNPDRMRMERPAPDGLALAPFWKGLSERGPRVVVIDVPCAYAPQPFHGLEICGWGTHDAVVPTSASPPSMLGWVRENYGPSPRTSEPGILLPMDQLLKAREEERRVTDQIARIATGLMDREEWDLFLVGLTSTHRAGHRLWDESGTMGTAPEARERIRAALRDVYATVDEAVGRLVEAAGEDTTVFVFSLHGMGANTSRTDVLPGMLDLVLGSDASGAPGAGSHGSLDRVRGIVPGRFRFGFKKRLPMRFQDWLTAYWRMRGIDWSRAAAFCLIGDNQGYIRVNQRGREAQGIVEAGAEHADLCERIAEGLGTFQDADTGEPVLRRVERIEDIFPDNGPMRHQLPDLIVLWSPTPAARHHRIVSSRYGVVDWPTPGGNPSGRSGNHQPEGFVIATGAEFPAEREFAGAQVMDLVPTAFHRFDLPVPERMRGRDLTERLATQREQGR